VQRAVLLPEEGQSRIIQQYVPHVSREGGQTPSIRVSHRVVILTELLDNFQLMFIIHFSREPARFALDLKSFESVRDQLLSMKDGFETKIVSPTDVIEASRTYLVLNGIDAKLRWASTLFKQAHPKFRYDACLQVEEPTQTHKGKEQSRGDRREDRSRRERDRSSRSDRRR